MRIRGLPISALVTLLAAAPVGCGAHRSVAPLTIDPGALATEPGWLVAAPTPDIRQRTAAECGAAALAMVAGRWMVPMTLDDALEITPIQPDLRVVDLKAAATSAGLDSYTTGNDPDLLEFELRAHRPVIVHLVPADGEVMPHHFEVVIAMRPTTQQVVTIDPARGWRVRHLADLDAEWKPTGRSALVVVGRSVAAMELHPKPRVVLNVAERHRPEAWP